VEWAGAILRQQIKKQMKTRFTAGQQVKWEYLAFDRRGEQYPKIIFGSVQSVVLNIPTMSVIGYTVLLETGEKQNFTENPQMFNGMSAKELFEL
jgi:hypothetical protein